MRSSLACILFFAATLAAAPLTAQETGAATASADLALMREKANADPLLRQQFEQIEQTVGQRRGVEPQDLLRNYLFRQGGMRDLTLDAPVRIATIEALEPARSRAQVVSQILAADLDGDWQITRDELTETIKYGMMDGAAQAFLIADANRDDILDTEELKSAVGELARARYQGRRSMPSLMPVFDFDGDGNLAREEVDRGLAALIQ